MTYRGRVAVVTGASSGIGRQLALDFAARGASLVVCARRGNRLAEVAGACRGYGIAVEALVGDVGDRRFVENLAGRASASAASTSS
jgi:NAD(P)-dependent dehydrogenase (short-subunit alcohol dehydrogenase family)